MPVKRLRLELSLPASRLPAAVVPHGVELIPWSRELADTHASLLFEGFQGEDDSYLLPSLATLEGCSALMRETVDGGCFLPEGSWLATMPGSSAESIPCGAIQFVQLADSVVRVMNLAVLREWRGRGIGRLMLTRALRRCRVMGFQRAQLDVTASNQVACALYESLGFQRRSVFFCDSANVPERQT